MLPKQKHLAYEDPVEPTRSALLLSAIGDKPTAELRAGHNWHIGNISYIDEVRVYFALGRTTASIVELFDDESGNFKEAEFETSPYTYVLLDAYLGVAAIARKTRLSQTTRGIARQFEKLLNVTPTSKQHHVDFEVSQIVDPTDLISEMQHAYSVTQFQMSLRRPNPFDVNEDFHRPLENLVREADADTGKILVSGQSLDTGVLSDLARSGAVTGEDVAAVLKKTKNAKPIRRRLVGNPVSTDIAEVPVDSKSAMKQLFTKIRSLYDSVRGKLKGKP